MAETLVWEACQRMNPISNFFDSLFVQNVLTTFLGALFGIPAALWVDRLIKKSREKKDRKQLFALWTWPWLNTNIIQKVPPEMPWSLLIVVLAAGAILVSYIRYVSQESNVDGILMNYLYSHDIQMGTYKHKINDTYICLNCLYTLKREILLQRSANGFMCTMKNCQTKYEIDAGPSMTPLVFGGLN